MRKQFNEWSDVWGYLRWLESRIKVLEEKTKAMADSPEIICRDVDQCDEADLPQEC